MRSLELTDSDFDPDLCSLKPEIREPGWPVGFTQRKERAIGTFSVIRVQLTLSLVQLMQAGQMLALRAMDTSADHRLE
jgi:hypothetical protein